METSSNFFENSGIKDSEILKWCKKNISIKDIFVDIGPELHGYSIILSKICNKVYTFESDIIKIQRVIADFSLNNCSNVIPFFVNLESSNTCSGKTLDSYNIENIGLIRIFSPNILDILKGSKTTILKNYPPILYTDHGADEWYKSIEYTGEYLKKIGYKIYQMGSYKNVYLATKNNYSNISMTSQEWCELATQYRKLPSSQIKSYDCIIQGLKLNPIDTRLLDIEMSIIAYYVGETKKGNIACDKITLYGEIIDSLRLSTLNNQTFYVKDIKSTSLIEINKPTNIPITSLCIDKSHLIYTQNKISYVVKLNKTVSLVAGNIILSPLTQIGLIHDNNIVGIVDGKLSECIFDFDTYKITTCIQVPSMYICHRSLFKSNNKVYYIKKLSPLTIYQLNEVIPSKEKIITDKNLSTMELVTGLVQYKQGWIGICRQIICEKKYFHRFIWYNSLFTSMNLGLPFNIEGDVCSISECELGGLQIAYINTDNVIKIAIISNDVVNEYDI